MEVGEIPDRRPSAFISRSLKKNIQSFLVRRRITRKYQAVIFALKKIKHLIGGKKAEKSEVELRIDSELVVNQLSGKYKIKEKDLIPFFIEIWNLKQDFSGVRFIYIPREENKKADWLVNRELDSQNSLF